MKKVDYDFFLPTGLGSDAKLHVVLNGYSAANFMRYHFTFANTMLAFFFIMTLFFFAYDEGEF